MYDLYQEAKDGIKDAQDWFNESHTPEDAQAVHQIAQMFKKKHSVKKENKEKQAALDKIQQTKKDPFESQKVESSDDDPEVDKLF